MSRRFNRELGALSVPPVAKSWTACRSLFFTEAMGTVLKTIAIGSLYTATAYVIDVPVRRAAAAKRARNCANSVGKPLLNIGAGTGSSALFGETLYGDINVDIAGRKDVPHGMPGVVTYADAHDLSDFATSSCGAILASHCLEHLKQPDVAIREWLRVVGGDPARLFIVTPTWWAPHTWLHPGHFWYFCDGVGGSRDPNCGFALR